MNSEEWNDGFEAGSHGRPSDVNPYQPGGQFWYDWQEGWAFGYATYFRAFSR